MDIAPGVVEVLVAKSASAAIREQLRASLSALRVEPYKQALHAVVTIDFRPVLPKITVPTVVLHGGAEADLRDAPIQLQVLSQ